jgi:tRNA A37 methylthiotransferase MiaB
MVIAAPVRRTPRAPRTAAIRNLGCKVNQAEMEAAARLLRERGVTLVDDRSRADLYLVNTCTVTSVADQKSRQAVRRARRVNPDAELIVTGCSVQVDPSAFAAAAPGARLVDNRAKDGLLAELARLAEADGGGVDEATRNHIRNMDVYLARLLDETVQGRSQMTHELRSEIKMVARTIAAAAAGDSRVMTG